MNAADNLHIKGVLSWAEKGFIIPKQFENDKLIYVKEYFTPPVPREFEIEFLPLSRWEISNNSGTL